MKKLLQKLKESTFAILPITLTIIIFGYFIANIDWYTIIGYIIGSIMLIIGMTLFTIGADISMMPMGEKMGSGLTKTKKLWLILLVSFMTGFLITIAEPGLMVLSERLSTAMPNPQLNKWILLIVVGIGVGLFLLIGMIKTIFNFSLNIMLIIFYSILFILAIILSVIGKGDFLSVAFDSGGATTGAITVPFIMAYGIGIASIKGDEKSSDNFGYIGLASIGPILSVLFWGAFSTPPASFPAVDATLNIKDYLLLMPATLLDVLLPVMMILIFFLIFQFTIIKMPLKNLLKLLIGVLYTMIGLAVFLTGANVGFLPAGNLLGKSIAELDNNWILIPIGFLVGCFIVAAEPAIVVLNEKVEEVSGGTIKKKTMLIALMTGIGFSIALSMIRVLYHVNIWWIIAPGYIIALALSFFVPKVFTSIAFDSGGVASGPMTSAFLLPLAMGACEAIGGNVLAEAFGVIALVAMTPLVAIQIVGLIATIKNKKAKVGKQDEVIEIIDLY